MCLYLLKKKNYFHFNLGIDNLILILTLVLRSCYQILYIYIIKLFEHLRITILYIYIFNLDDNYK